MKLVKYLVTMALVAVLALTGLLSMNFIPEQVLAQELIHTSRKAKGPFESCKIKLKSVKADVGSNTAQFTLSRKVKKKEWKKFYDDATSVGLMVYVYDPEEPDFVTSGMVDVYPNKKRADLVTDVRVNYKSMYSLGGLKFEEGHTYYILTYYTVDDNEDLVFGDVGRSWTQNYELKL